MTTQKLDLVEQMQACCIDIATGRGYESRDFQNLRKQISKIFGLLDQMPRFIRNYRDAKQFWGFIKSQADTYADRRTIIGEAFTQILDKLESERSSPCDDTTNDVLPSLSSDHVSETWHRALDRRIEDPKGAITLARSLLEAVCKHILDDLDVEYSEGGTLPNLYSETAKHLHLAPSQHTERIFKQILGGCTSVVEGLGAFRNKSGDAHGRGVDNINPAPRHAELAVNLAGTMATFLVSTWEANVRQ